MLSLSLETLRSIEISLVHSIEKYESSIQTCENLLPGIRAEIDARLTIAENQQEAKID